MKTIAEVIAEHRPYPQANGVYCDGCRLARIEPWLFDSSEDHAAHVAQAIREARTVRTVEELDALPFLTVIREQMRPAPSGSRYGAAWEKWRSGEWMAASPHVNDGSPFLPALVLWTPGDEA